MKRERDETTTTLHKLLYFDFPGKAEAIRLALTHAGVSFEDHRFADRAEFQALKASGRLQFGQVPALEVTTAAGETTVLTQSAAILRYVAKLSPATNLYPADPLLAARVDAVCDLEADAFVGVRVSKYKERFGFGFLNEDKYAGELAGVAEALNKEVVPRHLTNLAKLLEAGKTGWLAGTREPSIADFVWGPVLDSINNGWTGDKDALTAFPSLRTFHARFREIPSVKAYYA